MTSRQVKNINQLNEMTYHKKQVEQIVESIAQKFRCHWAYIFISGSNCECYHHGRQEESTFCEIADNIELKMNKSKFDESYFKDVLTWQLDTVKDAEIFIKTSGVLHETDKDLPELDLNFELCQQFQLFMNELYEELPKLFSQKVDHSKEYFQTYIDTKMEKFNR